MKFNTPKNIRFDCTLFLVFIQLKIFTTDYMIIHWQNQVDPSYYLNFGRARSVFSSVIKRKVKNLRRNKRRGAGGFFRKSSYPKKKRALLIVSCILLPTDGINSQKIPIIRLENPNCSSRKFRTRSLFSWGRDPTGFSDFPNTQKWSLLKTDRTSLFVLDTFIWITRLNLRCAYTLRVDYFSHTLL